MATKTLLLALLTLLSIGLQSSVAPHLSVLGARPDLPVLLTMSVALVAGPAWGMAVGFLAGLLVAGLEGAPAGVVAALFVAAGYAAGALRGRLAVEHWPVAALAVGFLTVAFEGARGLLGAVEGWTWPAALLTLAGTGLYNAALACPACALLRRGRSLLPGAAPAA